MSTKHPRLGSPGPTVENPVSYRQGQIDALGAVLIRAQNGATSRALLVWVYEQLIELKKI
jgi:hypothetical protein